jgi:hypothetical protein
VTKPLRWFLQINHISAEEWSRVKGGHKHPSLKFSGGNEMPVKRIWDSKNLIVANDFIAGNRVRTEAALVRERDSMRLAGPLFAAPLLWLLAACSSAADPSTTNTSAPVTTNGTAVAPVTSTTTSTATTNIGVNTATIQYWGGSRPFVNLIYGSGWSMQSNTSSAQDIPQEYFDANGWVKSLPAGYHASKVLSIPASSADIVCTYTGNGLLNVGGPVSNVVQSTGKTTFHYNSSYPAVQWASVYFDVDPSNYVRNINCHEAGSTATSNIAPEFVSAVKGFQIIRFMGWVPAVIDNPPSITWATRNKPGDGDYTGHDGVPVEEMVDLANQANVDPWFSIPWNADDDYVIKFATYVRDHLAAGHKVYVENSNEVWNWAYPVTRQAANEGAAEGLPSAAGGDFQLVIERYAEKTQHLMQLWSNVFAGQTNRLVRVAAFQNAQPYWTDYGMGYNNLSSSVDAVSTAPYWAFMPNEYTGQSLDSIMGSILPSKITEVLGVAAQNKQIAAKYGKRYIAYEGGQHVILSNLSFLGQIERDARMYDLYKSYINGWNSQAGGDSLVLTNLQGPIASSGAWGMQEWIGQPVGLSTTPKLQAVREFLGVATTSASSSTAYQTCSDGTVILATSACPTSTTSGSGSSGLKKGAAKRGFA